MSYIANMSDIDYDNAVKAGAQLAARIKIIVETIFAKGIHYGSATGTEKKTKDTLLKPGAEAALDALGLTADHKVQERFRAEFGAEADAPLYSVSIRTEIKDRGDHVVAVGYAAGNTGEKKFKRTDYDSTSKAKVETWDSQNNVIKYAKKRSLVDAVLSLGFSAYFTQDLEEKEEGKKSAPAQAGDLW